MSARATTRAKRDRKTEEFSRQLKKESAEKVKIVLDIPRQDALLLLRMSRELHQVDLECMRATKAQLTAKGPESLGGREVRASLRISAHLQYHLRQALGYLEPEESRDP